MTVRSPYQYQLELHDATGAALGRTAINIDWEPAREWARFTAIRHGRLPETTIERAAEVQPVWHQAAGRPYVERFRLSLETAGGEEISTEFSTMYVAQLATAAATAMGWKAADSDGRFRYVTTAMARERDEGKVAAPRFTAREVAVPLTLGDGSLDRIAASSTAVGEPRADDMPVVVPAEILGEVSMLTSAVAGKETGGVLIGHLHRDRSHQEIFAEVTAQIPAQYTEADATSLTFTPGTWTAVSAALNLRARGEIMLGWWHSHPVREWCKDCAPERQRTCSLAAGFLSAHDRALHRHVFPRAYSLALVVNDVACGGPTFSLFGWRDALLEARGFLLVDRARARNERPAVAECVEGEDRVANLET